MEPKKQGKSSQLKPRMKKLHTTRKSLILKLLHKYASISVPLTTINS